MLALNALNAIVSTSPSGSSAHRQASYAAFLAGLEPGRHLRATVHAALLNGEFAVMMEAPDTVDKQLLHMKLPAGLRPGDALNLIFVSRNPRPAFMLMTDTPATAISVPLSRAGRFISGLLGRSASPDTTSALSNRSPLLAAPPADGVLLARSLAGALGQSGLFYESHQAQWIAGARPLEDLLLEPQAPLSGLRPSMPGTNTRAGASAMTAMPAMSAMASESAADAPAPVHPDALALVRQQLEAFEMRQVSWQGIAWPGQTIEWEVAEEKPDSTDEPDQIPAAWQSRLNLTLPNLGQISASLRLDAHGVEVRVTAAEPVTAFMLRAGAAPLAEGLESAGIKLLGMGVDLDEAT
ncbi:flagellar hook-length control protein FliK [Nitrosovibrio sp. Nv6]|uniref:flagellar hook-length control protein FliK n=1 Tax=Nitrosovibrio sp. Nv6 TaxID=1855340 RepID=UPI0008AC00A4|nr:flagellar hook-length control protein FliK [Nitrosovibrio sp. Nv6]SEO49452.1 hook-length control protein FliK [Nitrosovibrio sp. Nv6]